MYWPSSTQPQRKTVANGDYSSDVRLLSYMRYIRYYLCPPSPPPSGTFPRASSSRRTSTSEHADGSGQAPPKLTCFLSDVEAPPLTARQARVTTASPCHGRYLQLWHHPRGRRVSRPFPLGVGQPGDCRGRRSSFPGRKGGPCCSSVSTEGPQTPASIFNVV